MHINGVADLKEGVVSKKIPGHKKNPLCSILRPPLHLVMIAV
jgi:hypothetical protein